VTAENQATPVKRHVLNEKRGDEKDLSGHREEGRKEIETVQIIAVYDCCNVSKILSPAYIEAASR
jgi:hypothetical protein